MISKKRASTLFRAQHLPQPFQVLMNHRKLEETWEIAICPLSQPPAVFSGAFGTALAPWIAGLAPTKLRPQNQKYFLAKVTE